MWIGLDFGTTHSGAAWFDGQRVHLLPLDPVARNPAVVRSTLYITREHHVFIGQEAIDLYYRQNIGRPSHMVRQYVGEIEVTLGGVDAVKGYPAGPETFVREVYTLIDELTPGRLLRSLKSGLTGSHQGTMLFGRRYELEDLLALYLGEMRRRVEAHLGQAVKGVVLGRPVHFVDSQSQADDQLAEERLRRAAEQAGFGQVVFELEPVAAALNYELQAQQPQNIIVFDMGGGTLDITVMRVGGGERQVFASGGVGIAGDTFDQHIMQELLLEHFGRGSTILSGTDDSETAPDAVPFPNQYTDALIHWQTIPDLSRPETRQFLSLAQQIGSHPARVRALESLLLNNKAIHLIDQVEQAKIALSDAFLAAVRLHDQDIDIWQPITRSQFESLIAEQARQIEVCLLDTVQRSGLPLDHIQAVVRTGGSSQIPYFIEMLRHTLGRQMVVADVFSSVTAGLAVRAAQIK